MNGAPRWETPQESARTQGEDTAPDQAQLDLPSYQREMATAARKAGERASRESDPAGFETVLDAIEQLAAEGCTFDASDVRARVGPGYEGPMGAAFATARRNGTIEAVGIGTSRSISRHGGLLRTWRRRVGAS